MVMGNLRKRKTKSARKKIPKEIIEEIREKGINDMTDQRHNMDTHPISVL